MGAGLVVVLIPYGVSKCVSYFKDRRVYTWLKENSGENSFKTTAEIAAALAITAEQVRKRCSRHKRICESMSQKDSWCIRKISREAG
jgi:hypothetical protein